jgi:hypothetical protein
MDNTGHRVDDDALLTTRELAQRLRVSTRSVERWRREPPKGAAPLKWIALGRRRLYRITDVRAFIDARTFENTAQAAETRERGAADSWRAEGTRRNPPRAPAAREVDADDWP